MSVFDTLGRLPRHRRHSGVRGDVVGAVTGAGSNPWRKPTPRNAPSLHQIRQGVHSYAKRYTRQTNRAEGVSVSPAAARRSQLRTMQKIGEQSPITRSFHPGEPTKQAYEYAVRHQPQVPGTKSDLLTAALLAAPELIPEAAVGTGIARILDAVGTEGRGAAAARAALGPAARVASRAAETPVGRAAVTAGERAAPVARPVGKAVRYAVRHPVKGSFGASLGAQVPAAITARDPSQLMKGLEGGGILGTALGSAGTAVKGAIPGLTGRALADLINLPAQVPPTLYLTGAGLLEAAQGRPSRIEDLWSQYKATDFLPALLSGHPGEALSRVSEHPVYAAAELGGIKAGLGRGIGAFATKAGETRPPLYVHGGTEAEAGGPLRDALAGYRPAYSRDIFSNLIQHALDRRAGGREGYGPTLEGPTGEGVRSIRATPRQGARVARSAVISDLALNRAKQLAGRAEVEAAMNKVKPSKANANVVKLMIERTVRNPETAVNDLKAYRAMLKSQRPTLDSRAKLDANAESIRAIDAAIKSPDPEGIARATNTFLDLQAPMERDLIERGILHEEQAYRRNLFVFARTRMGARHGYTAEHGDQIAQLEALRKSDGGPGLTREQVTELQRLRSPAHQQLITDKGQPLSNAEIVAEMKRQGVPFDGQGRPQAGYVSNVPGGADRPGSYFRGYEERPRISRKRITGEAAVSGLSDLSWENVVGTLQRQRTLAGSSQAFDDVGRNVGIGIRDEKGKVQPFSDPTTARQALENPEDFGLHLPPIKGGYDILQVGAIDATRAELEAARHFGPNSGVEALRDLPDAVRGPQEEALRARQQAIGEQIGSGLDPELENELVMEAAAARALLAADPTGRTYIVPKASKDILAQAFVRSPGIERAWQGATGWLKRAWLPTNPGWFLGNGFDNYVVRTLGTGLTPGDILSGHRLSKLIVERHGDAGPAVMQRLIEEGLFGSVKQVQPRRLPESFAGSPILGEITRAGAAFARVPGPKQALNLFNRYSNGMFQFESKAFEQMPRYAELSRQARNELGINRVQWRSALKNQDQAVTDFIDKGLRNTGVQRMFAEQIDKTYGNWIRMRPETRTFLSSVAPFWTWARAATRFVFLTMPLEHPIITGILAAATQMTTEERKALGFDQNAPLPMPGFLQGGIPLPGGKTAKLSNLSSYGFFATFPDSYATMFGPQVQSTYLNAIGIDWKGDALVNADGSPVSPERRVALAIGTFGSQFVPFFNVAQSVAGHGPSGLMQPKVYDKSYTDYLRNLQREQTIHVPIKGAPQIGTTGSADPSNPWGGGSSSTATDNPWATGTSSASSDNPWAASP